jgi:hypothetical protein
MSCDEIEKEKSKKKTEMSTHINFLNLKLGLLYQKHYTWKNHEAPFPINQMLKDEIGERQIHKKIKK